MIRRHDDVIPLPPEACPRPCPKPPTPIIPVVSVSSVNGQTGDVILKDLIINEKLVYNGADEVVITLQDLDLETAVIWRGFKTKEYIIGLEDTKEGDLYFCVDDKLLYLCISDRRQDWVNIRIALTDEDIRTISIAGTKQRVDDAGNIDIPEASGSVHGVVKLSEQFSKRPSDGCMIINFENIQRGSIDVNKLKGDLWLKADISVEKPNDID